MPPLFSRFKKLTLTLSLAASFSLIAASAHSMTSDNELPDLGASALGTLSIEKERRLGHIIYDQLRGQTAILQDPLIIEYLNDLGNKLVAKSEDVNFPFTFFGVNNNQINAFAFYGGFIGVHTGLIAKADNESQLASVLAHEIAHVTQRHLARGKEAANNRAPLTLAGIVGSILLAAINPQLVMASMMATSAGTQQAMINYTRGNEQEADNIGMNILANAGYDPYASAEFFAKLQEQIRYKADIPAFLITHPLPESRVTDARLRAMQFEKKFYADSLEFMLVKARINARYVRSEYDKIKDLTNLIDKSSGNKKFALQYELLLRLVDDEQFDKAFELWESLVKVAPNNLYLLDTYSDLAIAAKKPELALEALSKAYKIKPNNYVVTLNYANVALEAKMPDRAIELLEYYLLNKPRDLLATQMLVDAYKDSKNMAKYNITKGELFALMARYNEAITFLDRALAMLGKNDNAEINRIQALKYQYRERQQYIKDIKGTI